MKNLKVVKIDKESIVFENGTVLFSNHETDCCEYHWLCFEHVTIEDFEDLLFDLTNDDFFERIEDYGIALKPINNFPIRIPGYGSNNGYYSSNLELVLTKEDGVTIYKEYDITECQVIND